MSSLDAYASQISVSPGDPIDFMVSFDHGGSSPDVTIDFFRYGFTRANRRAARLQADFHATPADFNSNGCQWPVTFAWKIPDDWTTGVYIAHVTGSTGDWSDVLFVVRAPSPGSNSRTLLAITVSTAQAYNDWGGTSLYSDPVSVTVSFDRPGGLLATFLGFGEQRPSPGRSSTASRSNIVQVSIFTRMPIFWTDTTSCSASATTSTGRRRCGIMSRRSSAMGAMWLS